MIYYNTGCVKIKENLLYVGLDGAQKLCGVEKIDMVR
jgi:hypothetical protein